MHKGHAALVTLTVVVALTWTASVGGAAAVQNIQAQAPATPFRIVGWNNLGMHCMDADFAVFAILPPYNTVVAHVLDASGRLVTSSAGITVTYEAVADPSGSINATSQGKTNFWDHVSALFGVALPEDVGLAGKNMPGPGNSPQQMSFDPARKWFIGEGIPITPYDDAHGKNPYPLMRLTVRSSTGALLASTDVVLPVSDEMDCSSCHASGSGPAARPAAGWVFDPDPQRDFRLNVLRLHDDLQSANPAYAAALAAAGYRPDGLYPTVTIAGTAILCANCHGSEALPGSGRPGIPPLTAAMHSLHATVRDPTNGLPLESSSNRSACYRCHPGSETRCLRGAMGNAVALDGTMAIQCQNCHGPMSAVGSPTRTGWLDEPTCQSCHTGTAVANSGQIRYDSVFDSSGLPRVAVNLTFATDPNTPAPGHSLYRFSDGHGGLQCSGCHGSTHAEYPSSHGNDNLQSLALQGHVGTVSECASCHVSVPSTVTGGPHGMHPVGQVWIDRHKDAAEHDPTPCRACHGADYRGTVLSRAFASRDLSTSFGARPVWRGFQLGCYNCHLGPTSDDRNPNRPAVASDLTAATGAGVPVGIQLLASDPDGNPLNLRVVSQPANGTVGLSGSAATYFPFAGFAGSDTFTYAAWDGSTDSNLARVNVTVGAQPCTLSCSASAPTATTTGASVQFQSSATPSNCTGNVTDRWDFGDGSTSGFQNPTHTYSSSGIFHWTFTASIGGVSCTRSGNITVSAPSTCTLACTATVPPSARVRREVRFTATATASSCAEKPRFNWSFGDGSTSSDPNTTHTHRSAGTFHWRLTVTSGSVTCTREGNIVILSSSRD